MDLKSGKTSLGRKKRVILGHQFSMACQERIGVIKVEEAL